MCTIPTTRVFHGGAFVVGHTTCVCGQQTILDDAASRVPDLILRGLSPLLTAQIPITAGAR